MSFLAFSCGPPSSLSRNRFIPNADGNNNTVDNDKSPQTVTENEKNDFYTKYSASQKGQ